MDILSEDGFARLCKLHIKQENLKINTPAYILPISDFLSKFPSYLNLANKNNVIYSISHYAQHLPTNLDHHLTLCNENTTYYNGVTEEPEAYIPNISSSPSRVCFFFSKQCPSIFFSDEFAIEWYKTFFEEIFSEIQQNPEKFRQLGGFGLIVNLQHIINYELLEPVLREYLDHPIIKEHLLAIEFQGLFDNKLDYSSSINFFFHLKSLLPADVLYIASGNIKPYEYGFIISLGFDAIDLTYLIYSGFSGLYFHHEEEMEWVRKLNSEDDFACVCEFCKILQDNISSSESNIISSEYYALIALHNVSMGLVELDRIRNNIKNGSISTYVEKKSNYSLFLLSALRYLRKTYKNQLTRVQSLNKSTNLPCTSSLSYSNPNVEKFRRSVMANVEPNSETRICIFLPCSMVKPYSKSKSHRKFHKIIRSASRKWNKYISEVIITSPLSLVPRELEEVFPAAHYDISVTGDWDAEELTITADGIVSWIEKLPIDVKLIGFLHGGYKQAFELALLKLKDEKQLYYDYSIVQDNDSFKKLIEESIQSLELNHKKNKVDSSLSREELTIKMLADFQLGVGAGKILIGTTARFLQSRNELYKTIVGFESYGKLQLARYDRSSGHIRLNYHGGEKLKNHSNISVVLNTSDITGTTIFKPAIAKVGENLCSGDEIVILGPQNEYLGIGSLIVNSNTVARMRRGAVVKIRKMKKEV